MRDITDRRQMEEQLRSACDDLEHQVATRTADLAAANAQLRHEIEERQQAEQTMRY